MPDFPFLTTFAAEMQGLTLALREVVLREMPGAVEDLFTESFNYSPDGKYGNRIVYIWPGKSHATLGFFFGTSLDDSENLLEGEGKRMRHIKVRNLEEARSPALAALVRQAWELAPECLLAKGRK